MFIRQARVTLAFEGINGAGKSRIIAELKQRLEIDSRNSVLVAKQQALALKGGSIQSAQFSPSEKRDCGEAHFHLQKSRTIIAIGFFALRTDIKSACFSGPNRSTGPMSCLTAPH